MRWTIGPGFWTVGFVRTDFNQHAHGFMAAKDGKFRDPAAIGELEHRCEELVRRLRRAA